jgi:bacterioferritin-associated ferredoxin
MARIPAEEAPATPAATVAGAAIAAGEPALSSSFRFHRPRGPICAGGYCEQCEIVVPEGRALACLLPVAAASGTGRRVAPLRPLGRVAEMMRPWFYERRFLRPRALRRLWLHALRHVSAAPSLAAVALPPRAPRKLVEVEAATVVVGAADRGSDAFIVRPDRGDVVVGVYPGRVLGVLRGDELLSISFERLVLATGSYERLPPVPGSDLPGVIGLDAFERYGSQGAIRPGTRVAAWAPASDHADVRLLAAKLKADLVWIGERAPRRIEGRRKVCAVVTDRARFACDLVLIGVRQPALELALQAGARARITAGELPVLVVEEQPEWLELVGPAAAQSSRVPDVVPAPGAILCLCEDVRTSDIAACVAQGFDSAELVKRRTGAMTGPCQGKMCAAAVLGALRDLGVDPAPTRARPLARPIALADLAADA